MIRIPMDLIIARQSYAFLLLKLNPVLFVINNQEKQPTC